MQIYGYCRISTPQQNIERQVRNILAAYPTAHIIRHNISRTQRTGQAAAYCATGGHHRIRQRIPHEPQL